MALATIAFAFCAAGAIITGLGTLVAWESGATARERGADLL